MAGSLVDMLDSCVSFIASDDKWVLVGDVSVSP